MLLKVDEGYDFGYNIYDNLVANKIILKKMS